MKTCKNLHKRKALVKKMDKPELVITADGSGLRKAILAVGSPTNLSPSTVAVSDNTQGQRIVEQGDTTTTVAMSVNSVTSPANLTSSAKRIVRPMETNVATTRDSLKDKVGDPTTYSDKSKTSAVKRNNLMNFFEEVLQNAHVLTYMRPVIKHRIIRDKPLESRLLTTTDNTKNLTGDHTDKRSLGIENLDLANASYTNKVQDSAVKRTLDKLGIDSGNTPLNLVNNSVGRQCTGDGENQTDSSTGEIVSEQPASSGASISDQTAAENSKLEQSDKADSDMEDPETEDANQCVFKCRLCTQEFTRPDKLALHVCWKHSPAVKLARLTQVISVINLNLINMNCFVMYSNSFIHV